MFNRMSALWLVLGVVGGYAAAGPSVKAQTAPASPVPPFVNPGDDVTLQFERGTYTEAIHSVRCAVVTIEGIWIKCAPAERFGAQREQKWLNLQRVVQITKREK